MIFLSPFSDDVEQTAPSHWANPVLLLSKIRTSKQSEWLNRRCERDFRNTVLISIDHIPEIPGDKHSSCSHAAMILNLIESRIICKNGLPFDHCKELCI